MDIQEVVKKSAIEIFSYEQEDFEELWNTDLWFENLIDSLGFVTLISQIEDSLGITIDLRKINPNAIKTFEAITQMLDEMLNSHRLSYKMGVG